MNAQNQTSETTAQVAKNSKMIEKLNALRELSKEAKKLLPSDEFKNLNDAIIKTFYAKDGHEEFKSFEDWKKEGKSVVKGSKAFLIWGAPVPKKNAPEGEQSTYWPIRYLFSNLQVVNK